MARTLKKALLGVGVVSVLGVAMMPLTTIATTTQNVEITATIDSTLTLSVNNSVVNLGVLTPGGAPSTGQTTANVVTNNHTGYNLSIRSLTAATAMAAGGGREIPALGTPGALNAVATQSAWGYRIGAAVNFTGVTATDVQINTLNTTTTALGHDTLITFGAFARDGQAAGNYSATVVLTAVANV